MPDLLLELFSEEIPARMQFKAGNDLAKLMTEALTQLGIAPQSNEAYSGPRRVTFIGRDIPSASAAVVEERKGPRVGAPEKAVAGFLRAAGVTGLEDCEIVADPKGDYYAVRVRRSGRLAQDIVAEAVPGVIRKFPWPKSMRWGDGHLAWVRPLRSILCLFDDSPVAFGVDGVESEPCTYGHRFMSGDNATSPQRINISSTSSYTAALMHAKVVVAREQRARIILEGAQKVGADFGLALVEDYGLLDENAGLVEWPVVLTGRFDEAFLAVPQEILLTAMRTHQKYFSLKEPQTGQLSNRFALVANLEAEDGGKAIVAGNERVIRARLSDAKFFWDNDRIRPLDDLVPLLSRVTFHDKLGTQLERVSRLQMLAKAIAPACGAEGDDAARAAYLAKADLLSQTVGEFPELQGTIGGYIALAQGENAAVADAIATHYRPQGPSDAVPAEPVAIAVALADKLDTLASFWMIGETPTGSKDPYALRRAALGVIRIVIENRLRLPLVPALREAEKAMSYSGGGALGASGNWIRDLVIFFTDRLKVYLRDTGVRFDAIDAVLTLPGGGDDLLAVMDRVRAIESFLGTEDGDSLLVPIRRALSILKIEEKKDGKRYEGPVAAKLAKTKEEKTLYAAIKAAEKQIGPALAANDFEGAMAILVKLRDPVDAFFDSITVNDLDRDIRANRLALLARIRVLTLQIADFTRIEG